MNRTFFFGSMGFQIWAIIDLLRNGKDGDGMTVSLLALSLTFTTLAPLAFKKEES